MRGNIPYDILVSDRLMYFMLGHLSVRASTCLSLTRSLARFMATKVGVTKLQFVLWNPVTSLRHITLGLLT